MRIVVLSIVLLSLPIPRATAVEDKTRKGTASDYIKVEARGTIHKTSQTIATPAKQTEYFAAPPNICAGSIFFEQDVQRYKTQLAMARALAGVTPRVTLEPQATKEIYSLRVRGGKDLELDIDDEFAPLFAKQVGKQVTIVGKQKGMRVRVTSVNGLTLE